ncbi:MAG TPA: hypothetical protein VEK57_13035, partial [Thermoanaerobaculia bacterium]|nr:hypothetical protein [Thermoanaerobaculia bacterium]
MGQLNAPHIPPLAVRKTVRQREARSADVPSAGPPNGLNLRAPEAQTCRWEGVMGRPRREELHLDLDALTTVFPLAEIER